VAIDEVQLQQGLDAIKEYYQNHGYIDVEVQETAGSERIGPLLNHYWNQGGDALSRQQTLLARLQETTEEKIRKVIKMKEGSVYSPKDLHDDAKAIADNYGRGRIMSILSFCRKGLPPAPV